MKKYCVILSVMLVICFCIPSSNLFFDSSPSTDFSEKFIYENSFDQDTSLSDEPLLSDEISVILLFDETFSCDHNVLVTESEIDTHKAELKDYYSNHNLEMVGMLGLNDYTEVNVSWYGPFIEYNYETYADFLSSDYSKLEENEEKIETVFVKKQIDYEDEATRAAEDASPEYSFSDALYDIGIPNSNNYDGTGVKIGIVESGVPNSLVNLTGVTYEFYGASATAHAVYTSSILGATTGIASGAELYFAALSDHSFLECMNWLISKDVDVINRSNGADMGTYTSDSALADYFIAQAKVVFVNSAGNAGDSNVIVSPSTGVDVISVAASDANFNIAYFSSAGLQSSYSSILLKPTLTAPGANLCDVPNVPVNLDGTSYSAPMVTGVIALLMQEFPSLKGHPEAVSAILANTSTPVNSQTGVVDYDAGFGLVNYSAARAACANRISFNLTNSYEQGDVVYSTTVEIDGNTEIYLTLNALFNDDEELTDIPNLQLAVRPVGTTLITYGETNSNFSYVKYANGLSTSEEIEILVYMEYEKATNTIHPCSIAYHVEPHECHYVHHYEQYSVQKHRAYCECGSVTYESHVFVSLNANIGNAQCTLCGFVGIRPPTDQMSTLVKETEIQVKP